MNPRFNHTAANYCSSILHMSALVQTGSSLAWGLVDSLLNMGDLCISANPKWFFLICAMVCTCCKYLQIFFSPVNCPFKYYQQILCGECHRLSDIREFLRFGWEEEKFEKLAQIILVLQKIESVQSKWTYLSPDLQIQFSLLIQKSPVDTDDLCKYLKLVSPWLN